MAGLKHISRMPKRVFKVGHSDSGLRRGFKCDSPVPSSGSDPMIGFLFSNLTEVLMKALNYITKLVEQSIEIIELLSRLQSLVDSLLIEEDFISMVDIIAAMPLY